MKPMKVVHKKAIVAYVPVLHEGYRKFFESHRDCEALYVLGNDVTREFKQLAKDLRAIDPELVCESIRAWDIFKEVKAVNGAELKALASKGAALVAPDEDVMRELARTVLAGAEIEFDSIFLRWDRHKSMEGKPVEADQTVSTDDKDVKLIALLREEAKKSPDIWRQIGAAIVKDGKIVLQTHNQAVPSGQLPYAEGDPRSDFSKGVNIEISTSFHCEARLIAEAAKQGISLNGTEMYVTTFPCPPCAKLIAYSGIKKLYYADGYGVLDGERVLRSKGVQIIFVKTV